MPGTNQQEVWINDYQKNYTTEANEVGDGDGYGNDEHDATQHIGCRINPHSYCWKP